MAGAAGSAGTAATLADAAFSTGTSVAVRAAAASGVAAATASVVTDATAEAPASGDDGAMSGSTAATSVWTSATVGQESSPGFRGSPCRSRTVSVRVPSGFGALVAVADPGLEAAAAVEDAGAGPAIVASVTADESVTAETAGAEAPAVEAPVAE